MVGYGIGGFHGLWILCLWWGYGNFIFCRFAVMVNYRMSVFNGVGFTLMVGS